jgi:hypothetical protein
MRVRMNGGPLDGQMLEFPDEQIKRGVLYWPIGGERHAEESDEAPGVDSVLEYLYQGGGRAEYVGGQLDEDALAG